MEASATGVRLPEAVDAKRGLKQKQDLWEAERKKTKAKGNMASGKKLMFGGKGKCHKSCTRHGGADKEICGSQRRNECDTTEPGKSCNERDHARPETDPPESTSGQRDQDDKQDRARHARDPQESISESSNEQNQARQARDTPESKT